nr:hypothetical protein [Tanacetum cinerariifolium]
MASMNTRLNLKKLDGNIVQKHGGSKQLGFKPFGPGVETGVHGVSNDYIAVAQRWLEDKQLEEKTNTDCLKSTQQCMKSEVAKHFGVAGIQQQNGFVDETNVTLFAKNGFVDETNVTLFAKLASIKQGMLEPVKVKLIFPGYHKSIMGNKLWRLDDITLKVVLYKNMGFNESGEYKKTFIGSGVGSSSVQVLQGVEFKVEPQEDHIFDVEPHGNVDHIAGS